MDHTADCLRVRSNRASYCDIDTTPDWPRYLTLNDQERGVVLDCPHLSHDTPRFMFRRVPLPDRRKEDAQ